MSEFVDQVALAIQKGSALEVGGEPVLSLETCRMIALTAIEATRPWVHQIFHELMPYIDSARIDRQLDEALK